MFNCISLLRSKFALFILWKCSWCNHKMYSLPQAKQFHTHVTYCMPKNLHIFRCACIVYYACGANVQVHFTLDIIVNLHTHTKWLFNGTHHWFMLDRDAIWKMEIPSSSTLPNWMWGLRIILKMFNTVRVQQSIFVQGAHVVRWHWFTLYMAAALVVNYSRKKRNSNTFIIVCAPAFVCVRVQ